MRPGTQRSSPAARPSVLHVVAPAAYGGLEQVVSRLAACQRERVRDSRVLAFLDQGDDADHPFVEGLRDAGVPVEPVALPHRAYGTERRTVTAAIRRLRPSVVHTHGARVDVLDSPVARREGVPAIATVHGFIGGGVKARLYELLHRRALRRVDAAVAVSRPLALELARAGVSRERLHVVPNAWHRRPGGVAREEARRILGLEGTTGPTIGWVGRLSPEKGCDVLLDALGVMDEGAIQAVVIGDGRERGGLERRARESGVGDRVRWLGAVRDAARVFSAFDVFILSSRTEGTPIALFEAIDAGVPIVATAVGGVPDVLGPDGGVLVPPDAPLALAAATRSVLRDPAAAAERASAAAERLRSHYGIDAWIERYETVYAAVTGRPVTGGSA